jgi:hypothetical protein
MENDIVGAAGAMPATSQEKPAGGRPLPPPLADDGEPPRLAFKELKS